tara:strand:+ start:1668 stop:2051 length:384 start_codon:yes stop_codon:yes gene_type:complete
MGTESLKRDVMEGQCHCGAVRWVYPLTPQWLTRCNCSSCRRTNGLWAYGDASEITVEYPADGVVKYVWGDKCLALVSCKSCGNTTHWEGLDPTSTRMAVNVNMADPAGIAGYRIRHFDGADSWQFLD